MSNERMFEDGEDVVLIRVSTFDQNITEDYINVGDKTTINNVTGYSMALAF